MSQIARKTMTPVLSLVVTFTILYFLFLYVERLAAGETTFQVIGPTIVLALSLFVVPLFFTSRRKKQKKALPLPEIEKKKFTFRLIKRVKLNAEFHPTSQITCPYCNNNNPTHTKLCLYCGRKIV